MRRGGEGSLKGRNKWVRPVDDSSTTPQPGPIANAANAAPPVKPLQRVGKYALAREPIPKSDTRPVPPKPAAAVAQKQSALGRTTRFKYERPLVDQSSQPAAATLPPFKRQKMALNPSAEVFNAKLNPSAVKFPAALPASTTADPKPGPSKVPAGSLQTNGPQAAAEPTPTQRAQKQIMKPAEAVVRPGKRRWNKFVRESLDVSDPEAAKDATSGLVSSPGAAKPPEKSALRAYVPPSTSGKDVRRSKRLQKAEQQQQRGQRAVKLLRLGGQLYSVSQRGKARSLVLQSAVPSSGDQGQIVVPEQGTAQLLTREKQRLQPGVSAGKTGPSPASKLLQKPFSRAGVVARSRGPLLARQERQQKPMSRLKGGRIVYCPVYCHTGKCPRRGRGCPYKHDPTKRAVCSLWLRNKCALGAACPLQHQRKPELMPACAHFLQVERVEKKKKRRGRYFDDDYSEADPEEIKEQLTSDDDVGSDEEVTDDSSDESSGEDSPSCSEETDTRSRRFSQMSQLPDFIGF